MRRALASLAIATVLAAGCGRATMATGAALTFTGVVGVGMGAAIGPGCEGPCFGGNPGALGIVMGARAILVGLVLIGSGAFIDHHERKQKAEAAAAEPPPPLPPPPPPPPSPPPPPRESGTWREVPPVPGDDAP